MDTLEGDCLLYYARGRRSRVSSRVLTPEPLRPSPCKSRLAFAFSLEEHAVFVQVPVFLYTCPLFACPINNLINNLKWMPRKGQEKQVSSRQLYIIIEFKTDEQPGPNKVFCGCACFLYNIFALNVVTPLLCANINPSILVYLKSILTSSLLFLSLGGNGQAFSVVKRFFCFLSFKVCQLRERRLDLEEELAEEKKTSETLKKEYDALVKKAKIIDSALKTAEADLEAFQVTTQDI